MRIAVMGSGGLGGYFGARLAAGGADVHFIARGSHLQAMRSEGSGGVVDLGRAKGVPTPLNRGVFDILALHAHGKAS